MNAYTLSDIYPGLEESFTVLVTEQMMTRFEQISGDVNPLHTDELFAAQKGFPDRVVYGMLTAAFYSTLVGVYLPGKYALLHGIDASFHAPVFPGDTLTMFGEVIDVNALFRRVEIKARIHNQQGKRVSRAKIKVGVDE